MRPYTLIAILAGPFSSGMPDTDSQFDKVDRIAVKETKIIPFVITYGYDISRPLMEALSKRIQDHPSVWLDPSLASFMRKLGSPKIDGTGEAVGFVADKEQILSLILRQASILVRNSTWTPNDLKIVLITREPIYAGQLLIVQILVSRNPPSPPTHTNLHFRHDSYSTPSHSLRCFAFVFFQL